MSHIKGLYIIRKGLILKCTEETPCIIRNSESEDIPCCYCCVKEIDKDHWIHNDHVCTSSECNEETYIKKDDSKNGLSRRTQHYGYIYNYKSSELIRTKSLDSNKAIQYLADLVSPNFGDNKVEQCIVNEYIKGQGISAHTDSSIFGSPIMTITLIGDCIFTMSNGKEEINYNLNPGDIVLLSGEARKSWKHCVKKIKDPRRISVTFRTIRI